MVIQQLIYRHLHRHPRVLVSGGDDEAVIQFMNDYMGVLMLKRFVVAMVVIWGNIGHAMAAPTVISLTQTGCQFLESEAKNHGFHPKHAEDCQRINASTQAKRLAASQPLTLQAGDYIFHVRNRDVPYELGFWLRGQGLSRFMLPSVSGGGIAMGQSKDYKIHLKTGTYLYSCPLNPTPNYTLLVK